MNKKHRSPLSGLLLALCAGVLIILLCVYLFFTGKPRPNIIFVSVDTLRADHLSCYGSKRKTSPHIDAFVEKEAQFIFENAYTPRAETVPALASALSGLYPTRHGVRGNDHALPDSVTTLPAVLGKAGYMTKAVIANPVIKGSRLTRDFAEDIFTSSEDTPQWKWDLKAVDAALSFLSGGQKEPFFLWLHLMDPHSPYTAAPGNRGGFASLELGLDGSRRQLIEITRSGELLDNEDREEIQALYDEEILGTDQQLGRLFSTLEKEKLLKNTIVVFFSDHGEELGEHHNYFFHSISVYRQSHHVPLFISLPEPNNTQKAHAEEKQTFKAPVSLVDLAPTIVSFAGAAFPGSQTNGLNLEPLFKGKNIKRDRVFTEYKDRINGVFTGSFHLVDNPGGTTPFTGKDGGFPGGRSQQMTIRRKYGRLQRFDVKKTELYDIRTDPLEQKNLANDFPELCSALKASINTHLENVQRPASETISEEARKRLKELGY